MALRVALSARPLAAAAARPCAPVARAASPLPLRACLPPAMASLSQRRHASAAVAAAAGGAAAVSGDVQGDMLEPSLANKQWVRSLAVAAAVAAAARSTAFLPANGIAFVHTLAFATWFGSLFWTTVVAGITMFRNLPRQVFGRLQSKLFPKYFGLSAACAAVLLATLTFGSGGAPPAREVQLLGAALAASLANLLFVEPKATALMFERYALENAAGARDEAAIKALYRQFGKWHGISSLVNLVVIVCAVGHGWWLGAHLAF